MLTRCANGGQRTTDAQAAAERIEDSACPRRRHERHSACDVGFIEPTERGTGTGHCRGDVVAGARGDEPLGAKQSPGTDDDNHLL